MPTYYDQDQSLNLHPVPGAHKNSETSIQGWFIVVGFNDTNLQPIMLKADACFGLPLQILIATVMRRFEVALDVEKILSTCNFFPGKNV